jgi:hypothetical protein
MLAQSLTDHSTPDFFGLGHRKLANQIERNLNLARQ